ncbi:hypothetical protein PMAYCL1PPCAC_23386 [Pristionchus mayeri]|uniref:Uncharacterized protein n=1 Tax=Pristionchus mayeri TaxID=1317129 RepID=A0AAN5I7F5_9BILA|nr:hypothetical protein PMAYCL1PPCAC_23386 [Pristionchus mayeri]
MGEKSEQSMSEGGTMQTDVSSFHSNDDTQSSIELEDAVYDFDRTELDRIVGQIPDTPNTRKSVTFDFTPRNASSSSSFPFPPPLQTRWGSDDGSTANTFGREVEIVNAGKVVDERPLLPTHRDSIIRRESVLGDISERKTHYMTTWVIFLLLCISFFLGGLFVSSFLPSLLIPLQLLPLASQSPSLPLLSPPITTFVDAVEVSLHVNRSTRLIRVTPQKAGIEVVSSLYSQSLTPLGNFSFSFSSPTQSRKCGEHVDEFLVCCKRLEAPVCYVRDGEDLREYVIQNMESIVDVETVQGRVKILTVSLRRKEFFMYDGMSGVKKTITIPGSTLNGYDYKTGFLQNGTIYSVFEAKSSCEQMVCIEKECSPVRNPQCHLEAAFPALPVNSLVFMHCDMSTEKKDGLYKNYWCTLSQLLLPSLSTIAKSAPLQYTRAYNENKVFNGFGDYLKPSLFHVNQLHLREDGRWEAILSSYRLHSLLV